MLFYNLLNICIGQKLTKSNRKAMNRNWSNQKANQIKFKFVRNHFFSIKVLQAHLQHVCNIPAKVLKGTLKALGGVNFTKYALLTIVLYVYW